MNNKQSIYLFTTLLFITLLTGCKSSKKVAAVGIGEAKAHTEFFDSMQKQAFAYHSLTARIQAEVNMGKNDLSSRVDLKILKDSALQLSIVPFLGVEVFRLEMTPDSVLVIDRLNRQYIFESVARLKGELPITFNYYNLQDLLANHLFYPGEKAVEPRLYPKFLLKQEGAMAEIQAKDPMGIRYTFMADGEEKLLSTLITDASNRYTLQWTYADFRMNGGQPFPGLMDTQVMADGILVGGIKMYFNRVQTEAPVKIELVVPDKYKRTTFAEMFKSLGLRKK